MLRFATLKQVSICQADLGLAESHGLAHCKDKLGNVSICQADLGLAEVDGIIRANADSAAFQSARQIWVWLK